MADYTSANSTCAPSTATGSWCRMPSWTATTSPGCTRIPWVPSFRTRWRNLTWWATISAPPWHAMKSRRPWDCRRRTGPAPPRHLFLHGIPQRRADFSPGLHQHHQPVSPEPGPHRLRPHHADTQAAASEEERDHFNRSFELIDQGVFEAEDIFVSVGAQQGMYSAPTATYCLAASKRRPSAFTRLLSGN